MHGSCGSVIKLLLALPIELKKWKSYKATPCKSAEMVRAGLQRLLMGRQRWQTWGSSTNVGVDVD